ncbi:RHS domain-containing protein [candidate division WOR-3 bacterium]|nr:RHS domain-containing protein [candidate division WOR-3 bacterium]
MTRNYTYSPAGNTTNKNTEHDNYTYQYDDLYRLMSADPATGGNEGYTYDLLDNRLTSAGVSGNWSYNANNELQGYDTVSFNYDANGNTTKKTAESQETNYIYDIEDRLIEVKDGNDVLIASYYYDPFGRRLWKEVDGTRTYFLYSDEGLVGEYDSTGAELRTYGYTPDSNWTTDPLFQKSGSIYYWYQNHHLGTPQKITSTSGAVAWAGTYDSFGNMQIGTETIISNLRFGGQYFDAETGLYYNLNRYYDPTIGRYLRTDPFGQGLNLYAYCFNNPHRWIDSYGLCAVSNVWNKWSDVAITTWDFWKNKPVDAWNRWNNLVTVNIDPFFGVTNDILIGIGQAGTGAWNALAYNEELHRGVVFGFRAAGVVTVETAKIVAQDVVLSMVKVPLTPAGSFAFSKSVGLILLPVNVVEAGDNTRNLSNRVQEIRRSVFDIR